MYLWCKHSGARVMTNTRPDKNHTQALTLDSAKNMTISGQICLREIWNFEITKVSFASLPNGVTAEYNFAETVIFNDGVPYPDILSLKKAISVKKHYTQVIWLTFRLNKNVEKSNYIIPVKIKTLCRGAEAEHEAIINLNVYSTVLPDVKDQSMRHEYFYNPYIYFPYKGKSAPSTVPDNFFKFERYSSEWWDFFKKTLTAANELRIETFYVPAILLLSDAGSKRIAYDKWELNFELIDKVIEFALKNGSFSHIAIDALLNCATNNTVQAIDKSGNIINVNYTDEEASVWIKFIFSALHEHLKEKGWLAITHAHLQDEPHQKETWLWARQAAKKYMPNIRCGEPFDMESVAVDVEGECDIYIPRLDEYEKNAKFFKNRQKKGNELWCYSCCFPEEGWKLNKFIDLPHVYSRQLHWACFSQGITGFLHWGFLFWYQENYGMFPDVRYKGDGYIVYPDVKNNAILLSARAIATRDGVQEYELLTLLAKKDKKSALKISRSVAKMFSDFNKNEDSVDKARKQILELLEN